MPLKNNKCLISSVFLKCFGLNFCQVIRQDALIISQVILISLAGTSGSTCSPFGHSCLVYIASVDAAEIIR